MSWGVPFSYEICTGCTFSIDPRLCVCILGVLPGGREGRVGHSGQKEILPEGGIDQMY